jgi:hypothetical protein
MDIFLVSKLISRQSNVDSFVEDRQDRQDRPRRAMQDRHVRQSRVRQDRQQEETSSSSGGGWVFFYIMWMILTGAPAAYLSWTSNTLAEWGKMFKVIFAVFAFFNGMVYLFGHLLFKYDILKVLKQFHQPQAQAPLRDRLPARPSFQTLNSINK